MLVVVDNAREVGTASERAYLSRFGVRAIVEVKCAVPGCVHVQSAREIPPGYVTHSAFPAAAEDAYYSRYRFHSCDDDDTPRIQQAVTELIRLGGGRDELF